MNTRFLSKSILGWIIMSLSLLSATGQNQREIDSLEQLILAAPNDTSKVSTLKLLYIKLTRANPAKALEFSKQALKIVQDLNLKNEVANTYIDMVNISINKGDYDEALEYGQIASKIYESIGDNSGLGFSYGEIGRAYRETGDYEQALEYHLKASTIFEESGDKNGMAASADNIGSIYREQGNYESALWFHLKASKFKEETGDKGGLGHSYDKIGRIYKEQQNYIKALEFHMKAAKFKEEAGDKKGMSYTFGEIGNIYNAQDQYARALEFHFKALKIREALDDKRGMGYTLSFIGAIFSKQGNYKKALEYFLQSSSLCETTGNKKGLGYAYDQIGRIYTEQEKYGIALGYLLRAVKISESMVNKRGLVYSLGSIGKNYERQGQYKTALEYQNRSLKFAQATGSKILIRDSYKAISNTYLLTKDYKNALEHYQLYIAMKDSAISEESLRQMANMEGKYQAEKKDKEISLLKKDTELKDSEAKKQKILLFSSLFALALASALAFLLFNRFKIKRKANEQLELLNAQMAETNLELDKLSLVARKTDNYVIIANSDDKIEWVNEGFTRITGYELDEVIGKTPPDVLQGTLTDPKAAKIVEDGVKDKKSFSVEILNYDKNDVPIWMSANVTPILNDAGDLLRYISVGADVTERKKSALAIQEQKKNIEEKNQKITESINYALRIQQSILPTSELIQQYFPESFMMYHPKDVVSGDFPWFFKKGDDYYIAAVDCTGHGVPGAFMSIIGHSLLNEIVRDKNIDEPSEILASLHEGVNRTLKQTEEGAKSEDGMELALCKINLKQKTLEFSGANRPLYMIANGELIQYKGDQIPIGGNDYKFWMRDKTNKNNSHDEIAIKFTNHNIKFEKGDSVFFFSDGLADQFGGPESLKFGPKRIRDTITNNQNLPMQDLSEVFNKDFEKWKGSSAQIDDVLLIGVRF